MKKMLNRKMNDEFNLIKSKLRENKLLISNINERDIFNESVQDKKLTDFNDIGSFLRNNFLTNSQLVETKRKNHILSGKQIETSLALEAFNAPGLMISASKSFQPFGLWNLPVLESLHSSEKTIGKSKEKGGVKNE